MNENVPLINKVGEFNVVIRDPYWTELGSKDGDDARAALILPCYTEADDQNPNGQHLDYPIYFTRQLVTGGNNRGRPLFEVSQEQCIKLGMSEPFMPGKYKELDGVHSVLVTEEEEYRGKKQIKPKWLNTGKKKRMDIKDVNNLWARITSGGPKTADAGQESDANDIPY